MIFVMAKKKKKKKTELLETVDSNNDGYTGRLLGSWSSMGTLRLTVDYVKGQLMC